MANQPETKPLRKRPGVIAFLFAGVGLFFLNVGADSSLLHKAGPLGWMLIVAGAALLALAVLYGTGRV